MTPQQAREQIGFALKRAAPGSDIDAIDPDADLRDALELDSLDFLQFIEILSDTSGRRIVLRRTGGAAGPDSLAALRICLLTTSISIRSLGRHSRMSHNAASVSVDRRCGT